MNVTITTLQLKPDDSESVRRAIRQMESAVDAKVASYAGNPLVSKAAERMKQNFRQRVIARAKASA